MPVLNAHIKTLMYRITKIAQVTIRAYISMYILLLPEQETLHKINLTVCISFLFSPGNYLFFFFFFRRVLWWGVLAVLTDPYEIITSLVQYCLPVGHSAADLSVWGTESPHCAASPPSVFFSFLLFSVASHMTHTWPSAPSLGSPNLSSLFGQQCLPAAKCHTVLMWGLKGGDGHMDQVLDLQQKQSPLHTVDGDLRDLLSKIRWVQLSAHREDASLPGLLLLQIQIQLLQGCTMIHSSVGGAGHLQDLWLCVFHPFLWKQDGIRDFFCLLCRIQNTGSWRNLDLWWLWDWTQESRLLGANFQWPCFGAPCLRVQLTNTGCVILEQSLQKESWQRSISLFDMHIFCTNTLHLQLNDKQEIIEKERTMGCPISFLLKHIFSVSG